MPTFKFVCDDHGEFEDFVLPQFPEGKCPVCKEVGRQVFTACANTIVPPWMSATRSTASERQAEYLKSDKHRRRRQQDERIQERISNAEQKYESFKSKLDDKVSSAMAKDGVK
jgi:hypothetical protein